MRSKKSIYRIVLAVVGCCLLLAAASAMVLREQKSAKAQPENVSNDVDKPYGTKISNISDEGIQVYWKNTEFASGYEVYRSYKKDGKYECIAASNDFINAKESSHSTCTDTEFDRSKKTVYYKIRSYETDEQNETRYSKFSKVLTARYLDELKLGNQMLYLPAGMSRTIQASYGWGASRTRSGAATTKLWRRLARTAQLPLQAREAAGSHAGAKSWIRSRRAT